MARQPATTTTTTTVNGLIELTEHFVIFPSSIVILYQLGPQFFDKYSWRAPSKLCDKYESFCSWPRYKNIRNIRAIERTIPFGTLYVGSDIFQSRSWKKK